MEAASRTGCRRVARSDIAEGVGGGGAETGAAARMPRSPDNYFRGVSGSRQRRGASGIGANPHLHLH